MSFAVFSRRFNDMTEFQQKKFIATLSKAETKMLSEQNITVGNPCLLPMLKQFAEEHNYSFNEIILYHYICISYNDKDKIDYLTGYSLDELAIISSQDKYSDKDKFNIRRNCEY